MRMRTGRALLGATLAGATIALVVAITRHPVEASTNALRSPEPPETSTSVRPVASSTPSTPSSKPPSTPPAPAPSPETAEHVLQAMRKSVPSAQVAVEVYDQQTGTVLTSLNANQQFASMSVVKLFIALDALHQNGWALPDEDEQRQLTEMISSSDDDIASDLWEQDGEGAIITRDVKLLGLTGTAPPSDSGEWGDTRITAQDLVTTYHYVTDSLPAADHDLLYNAMYNATKTAADGTDQYFGIPDGLPGTTWAIKQGWGSSGPEAVYNTTGLVGPTARYVVIVLSSAPLSYYKKLGTALTNGTAQLASLVSGP